jgi:DNA (cytosine-5)-methyltransferase 1
MSRPGGSDSSKVRSSDVPLQTITTCDAMQGVFPMLEDGKLLDIRIRMLKPSELAAAHSFPKDYILTGNRGEQVKQIGNSVPVMTAAAMCESSLMELKI